MIYYGAKDLAEAFRTVRNNTLIIADEIPEEKYSFRASPDTRTVAEMLAHIALSPRFAYQIHGVEALTTLDGFDFPAFFGKMMAEADQPRSKDQLLTLLRAEGDQVAGWLQGLSDEFLGQQVNMPAGMTPASKSRFEMLMSMKEHEMHHRSQLMLIERILGIKPHLTRNMEARMATMMAAANAAKATA
jgi:uncharacterized damage-inducible protein DinB